MSTRDAPDASGVPATTRRGRALTRLTGARPILMYHGVGRVDEDPFVLFVSPERFTEQMQTLRRLGLRGVSLAELGDAAAEGAADGLVGLTFDDGYRDVLTFAAPVLERCGFTATLFVVAGLLDGENVWDPPPRRQLVDEAEVHELVRRGWEIGSHSLTHPHLTELAPGRLTDEVSTSRTSLTDLVGLDTRCFCYPYGAVDTEVVAAVSEAGYTYACAVTRDAGLPTVLAMPRIGVTERDRRMRFAAKIVIRGR